MLSGQLTGRGKPFAPYQFSLHLPEHPEGRFKLLVFPAELMDLFLEGLAHFSEFGREEF